jgi:hypothetical protein
MKTYGGSGCIGPGFLDLDNSRRWLVGFRPWPLYPREKSHATHCVGSWVGPKACLNDVQKRNFLNLLGLELGPLIRSTRNAVAIPTELSRLQSRLNISQI